MKENNPSWSIDLAEIDAVSRAQLLVVMDDETRLIVGLRVETSFAAAAVLEFLDHAIVSHGAPVRMTSDRAFAFSGPIIERWKTNRAIEWIYAASPTPRTPIERVMQLVASKDRDYADLTNTQVTLSNAAASYNDLMRKSRLSLTRSGHRTP